MDALTLIWTAIEKGAQGAATKVGSDAVRDAYKGFRSLLRQKLKDKSVDHTILDKHSRRSPSEKARLKTALENSEAHNDPKVVESAHKVMALLDPKNAAVGKYSVHVTGNVQGMVQGDNAQVSITFGSDATKARR